MSELNAPPGTIVATGREILALNWAGKWLAPGSPSAWPVPDADGWTVVRWGDDGPNNDRPRMHLTADEQVRAKALELAVRTDPAHLLGGGRLGSERVALTAERYAAYIRGETGE